MNRFLLKFSPIAIKNAALVVLIVVMCMTPTSALSIGEISLFADEDGTECSLQTSGAGPVLVHMWLNDLNAVMAVQFKAPVPTCWTGATWVGDRHTGTMFLGDTQGEYGLSMILVPLGLGCGDDVALDSPVYIGAMLIMTTGERVSCCEYPVLKAVDAHAEMSGPIASVCDGHDIAVTIEVGAGRMMINPDSSCPCAFSSTPVEETTWGKVKSLYR